MKISKDFLLNLVQSEDLYWPEYFLYLACYFWSKFQACQQLETTLEEMSVAFLNPAWRLNVSENSIEDVHDNPIEDVNKNSSEDLHENSSEDLHENSSGDEEMQAIIEVDPATVKAFMEPFLPHIRLLSMNGSILEIILQRYCCFSSVEKNMIYSSFLGCKFACLKKKFCKTRVARTCPIEPAVHMFGYIETETENLTSGELLYKNIISEQFIAILNANNFLMPLRVRISTQCKPPNAESEFYDESFTVILTNPTKQKHVHGPFTKFAKYNSHVSTNIHPDMYFHGGKKSLLVKIIHHKSGLYPPDKPKMMVVKDTRRIWLSLDNGKSLI
jgi:hypothetical protein